MNRPGKRPSHKPLAAVVHARLAPSHWRDLLGSKTRLVCFVREASIYAQLTAGLDSDIQVVDTGELINKWMQVIRAQLVNLDACFQNTEGDALWQASDLAERNPYTSNLNYTACAWLAGLEALNGPRLPIVFVVENSQLGLALLREAKAKGYATVWRHPNSWVRRAPFLAGTWRKLLFLVSGFRQRWNFFRESRERKRIIKAEGLSLPTRGAPPRLVAVWADQGTFPPGGRLRDNRYFGSLPDFFHQKGERVLYLPVPVVGINLFAALARSLKASSEEFILAEQCNKTSRIILDGLRTLLWKPRIVSPLILAGRDGTWLLRDSLWEERSKTRQMFALQYQRIGPVLASIGVWPQGLLFPYENQPWDKLLRAGFGQSFPGKDRIGYLHGAFPPNYISFLPSSRDAAAGNIPDRLVTPGRAWRDIMEQAGMPGARLAEGPALRVEHLFASQLADQDAPLLTAGPGCGGARPLAVLLIGALDLGEFNGAMAAILPAMARRQLDARVWIKPHPAFPEHELRRLRALAWPEGVTCTSRPIGELLPLVDLVIHSGSTVALEALCLGKPALYLGPPSWFGMDTLDWFPGMSPSIRNPEQLARTMRDLVNETPAQAKARRDQGRALLPLMFNPVSEATLSVFFQ